MDKFEYDTEGRLIQTSERWNNESPYIKTFAYKTDSVIESAGGTKMNAWALDLKGYTSAMVPYANKDRVTKYKYDSQNRIIEHDYEGYDT